MNRYLQFFYFFFFFLCLSFSVHVIPISSQIISDQKNTMIALSENILTLSPLKPWNTTDPNPCSWAGVICSPNSSHVTNLSFFGFGLSTNSSTDSFFTLLCNLKTLQFLDLSTNKLASIPDSFFSDCKGLSGLKSLNLSSNKLTGPLPTFSGFDALGSLDMCYNHLEGGVDSQLRELPQLRSLNLSYNKFSGPVPASFGGKVMALEELMLSDNQFQGHIPTEIFLYRNLTILDLSENYLSGSVPDGIKELSKLEKLLLSSNNLSGKIPSSISMIKTLYWFGANLNMFNGTIPQGITKYLRVLDLSYNNLSGEIPTDLFSSPNLESIDLTSNDLQGSIPWNKSQNLYRLRLGDNSLNGSIPPEIGQLSSLKYLELDQNILVGEIPLQLENCTNLMLLNLAMNQLKGGLPKELGNLRELVVMKLQMNHLSGGIPNQFFELANLNTLNLSQNSLTGVIPSAMSGLQKISFLNLEENQLNGSIPDSIGALGSLLELQLGNNHLSGEIPRMPSKLGIALNLSNNLFSGSLPSVLGDLSELEILDLSNNEFTGEVPNSFARMQSLTRLVLSNNQLSGTLPTFHKWVIVNTTGNTGLVLSTTDISPIMHKKRGSIALIIIVAVVSALVVSGFVAAILLLVARRRFYRVEDEGLRSGENPPQVINGCFITGSSIHRSNINFTKAMEVVSNPANLMLKTRLSTYYKAIMPSGISYLVKKLNWSDKIFQMGNHERFEQELQVLGKLSSSNVLIPLAYVLTEDCAYLFYEHVHKGTVFDFLHKGLENGLDWTSRYSIALGIAQGLTFLHGCTQPVLLLDLSTKSILLKSLKEPQIGDIELCKVIDPSKSIGSLSTVAGSVGYVPPEYAYTMRVTMAGNVYSFGVILLELLTGKPPVSGGIELAKWALSYSSRLDEREQILDSSISRTSLAVRSQMLSILKVALACVSLSPEARPKTRNVLRMLFNAR